MNGWAQILSAVIISAPGWAALYVANRRALRRQTEEIKAHITASRDGS